MDASDSSTLYDATTGGSLVAADGGVGRWQDKSGNGRHFTQSTAGSRPQRKISQINGLDALLFDGSNDTLSRSPESWAYAYPLTVFVVFRATAFNAAYNPLWDFYSSSGGDDASNTGLIKSNGKSAIYTAATNFTQPTYDGTGAITYSTSTNYVFSAVIANDSLSSWGNGTSDGTHSAGFTLRTNIASEPMELGASVKFSRYTQWAIGEVVVYNTNALTTINRQSVEAYLMQKWGAA
jgi:predicted heme/steroid binding protein